MRRSAIAVGLFSPTLAYVLDRRQDINPPATCGMSCLVPAYYGVCPSNDALCLCKTPAVVDAVSSCVLQACTDQDDRNTTIEYMLGVCKSFGVTLPIPSAFLPFMPSTLPPSTSSKSSEVQTPTVTSTIMVPPPTSDATPAPPNVAVPAAAATAAIAAVFIAVLVFIYWRRKRKPKPPQQQHPGGLRRGRGSEDRGGIPPPNRADTIESIFAGPEDQATSLLSDERKQPAGARAGYAGIGTWAQRVRSQQRSIPPQPQPSHLKPEMFASTREDRMRGLPTPVGSTSGHPSPSHSRTGSYERPDRYPDGPSPTTSLPSTAVSILSPFSGVTKPFASIEGHTPPSSASSPGDLQEKQGAAWGRRAVTEGSVPPTPAVSASASTAAPPDAPKSILITTTKPATDRVHRRNLTIDTGNLHLHGPRPMPERAPQGTTVTAETSGPADPNQVRPHGGNPPPVLVSVTAEDKSLPNSEEDAAAQLRQMFAFEVSPSPSDNEIHEALQQRYQTSPTDGGDDHNSPAVPESATMDAYGIGFGIMGRKWGPRYSSSNSSTGSMSAKKSMKGARAPRSPMRLQGLLRRGAAVPSMSIAVSVSVSPQPQPGPGAATPTSPPGPGMAGEVSPSSSRGGNKQRVVSTGTISSLFDAYRFSPSPSTPQGTDAIFELDEEIPPVPGTSSSDGSARPPSAPAPLLGGGGGGGTLAQKSPPPRGPQTPLAPRRAPPRHSVAPEDFSEEGLGLSRENTRRW